MLRAALVVFLAVWAPAVAYAAIVPTPSVSVTLAAAPSYPQPNKPVTVTAYASVPKGEFTYSWTVNGADAGSGIDLSSISVSSGAPGSETVIDVTLSSGAGVTGTAEYLISPADVDLLWEGATYVPPFYPGKPYPNGDSSIVLWAVPHVVKNGAEIPAGRLVYTWTVDGKVQNSLSGYGYSSIRIKTAQFKTNTLVGVTVEDPDGDAAAQASVSVPTVTPVLVLYEDRPLAGVWMQTAVSSSFALTADEASFKAVPYFVTNPAALTFNWTLSGDPFTPPGSDPSVVTLRKTGDTSGTAGVDVTAEKQGSIFERMEFSFDLSFN